MDIARLEAREKELEKECYKLDLEMTKLREKKREAARKLEEVVEKLNEARKSGTAQVVQAQGIESEEEVSSIG